MLFPRAYRVKDGGHFQAEPDDSDDDPGPLSIFLRPRVVDPPEPASAETAFDLVLDVEDMRVIKVSSIQLEFDESLVGIHLFPGTTAPRESDGE